MARDYKQQRVNKKQVFKRKSQQAQQGIVEKDGISFNLVFRFLLVLLFLSLIVIFYQFSDLFQDDELEVQTPSLELNETKKPDLKLVVNPLEQPKRTIKTIDYSFYNGLAETEVVVDIDPISIKLDSLYFIQAGTFGQGKASLN